MPCSAPVSTDETILKKSRLRIKFFTACEAMSISHSGTRMFISQRLRFRPELNIRVPECEILMATHAVKNFIRNRDFFKIISAVETGADHGMWSFQRYAKWLDGRTNLFVPGQNAEPPDSEPSSSPTIAPLTAIPAAPPRVGKQIASPRPASEAGGRIEIEPDESDFGKILKKPE